MKDDEVRIPIHWVPLHTNDTKTINKAIDEIIRKLKYKKIPITEGEKSVVQQMIDTTIISGYPPPADKICPIPSDVTGIVITDETLYVDPTTGITLASVKVEWDNNADSEKIDVYEILWND